jgi:putative ABC transport system permease protein
MSVIDGLIHRLNVWRGRATYEHDIEDEMRFHIALDAEHQAAGHGSDAASATSAARRRFGNVGYFKEETRQAAGLHVLDGAIHDGRHLVRSLLRAPGFTTVVVLTLALGIGATTAVLSIVDHVLLHSLPFRDPNRLVMMYERDDHGDIRPPSYPTVSDWQRDSAVQQAFDGLTFIRGDGAELRLGNDVGRVTDAFVGRDFFRILGARPLLGRTLVDDDQRADAPPVAVLSYSLWQRRFGGDAAVLGRRIPLDSIPTIVVGVMPAGAVYPGFAELWQPVTHYKHQDILARRGVHSDSRVLARLRPGVDSVHAVALMRTVSARLAQEYPADQARWSAAMLPVEEEIVGDTRPMLLTLAAAAAAVLLLACTNVANLLLARMSVRTRELAVRAALGASRRRLIRQLLTESGILALAGGVLGTAFAAFAVGVASKMPSSRLPRVEELAVDGRVLVIAAAASLLTALACGLWPAVRATQPAAGERLRSGTHGGGASRSDSRLRRGLVTVQFGLALMLLVGAGLLLQSFRRATAVPVGFDPRNLMVATISAVPQKYDTPEQAAALYGRLLQSLRGVPGVTDAALIQHFPLKGAAVTTPIDIDGRSSLDKSSNQVFYRTVSESYLQTMRMSLASGRWFTNGDIRSPGGSFVVNQTLARRYWPGESAIGKHITVRRASQSRADFGQPLPGTVIGVINDVHQVSQDVLPVPEVYVPYTLEVWPWTSLVVRVRDAAHAAPSLLHAVQAVDPGLLKSGWGTDRFTPVRELLSEHLEQRRFAMALIGAFAVCALLLAAIGMYGVIAYGVTQRTRELGVRKALGATDGMIASLVFRESLTLTALGIMLGCFGAWAGARLIRGMLFDTSTGDPIAVAATIVVLTAVALVATYLPARRATRLDPAIAIRGE